MTFLKNIFSFNHFHKGVISRKAPKLKNTKLGLFEIDWNAFKLQTFKRALIFF